MGAEPLWPPGEPLLRQIVDGTSAGIAVLDTELRYVYVNAALARMNGIPAADHIGRAIGELLPALDYREQLLRAVLADGRPREETTSGHTRAASDVDQRYWHGAYSRLETNGRVIGVFVILLEVTASRRQQRDLELARERLALLDTAATRIGTTLDIDTTCRELADFLVPMAADVAAVELVPPEGALRADGVLRLRRVAIVAVPRLREWLKGFEEAGDTIEHQEGSATAQALRTGRPEVLNLISDERVAEAAPSADRLRPYRAAGLHSGLVLPLFARGHPLGTVTMIRAGDSPPFADEDVVTAQDLAGRAAVSLDNARRYTREHGIAVELQRALLSEPGSPHPDLEVAFRYQPAGSTALVGGDWYETVRLPFGRTLLAMGDVMGHGVEASVDMSQYRSMLRYVASADLPPHRVLRRLDALISQSEQGRPATCLLALTDPARGRCSFSSAGHLPPALIGTDDGSELLDLPIGPPLGTGQGGYEMTSAPLAAGRVLLLYTDGLVERRGEDIDVSLERLTRVRMPAGGDLETFLDEVLRSLAQLPAEDDVAVLAARIRQR